MSHRRSLPRSTSLSRRFFLPSSSVHRYYEIQKTALWLAKQRSILRTRARNEALTLIAAADRCNNLRLWIINCSTSRFQMREVIGTTDDFRVDASLLSVCGNFLPGTRCEHYGKRAASVILLINRFKLLIPISV